MAVLYAFDNFRANYEYWLLVNKRVVLFGFDRKLFNLERKAAVAATDVVFHWHSVGHILDR